METAMAGADVCTRPCRKRCSHAKLKRKCMKFCRICCGKCKCVPGAYGKRHCPCYSHVHTLRGRAKCP
ncbi:Snakin-1, partial [Cucurbita argyrosperma subsp. sororia]